MMLYSAFLQRQTNLFCYLYFQHLPLSRTNAHVSRPTQIDLQYFYIFKFTKPHQTKSKPVLTSSKSKIGQPRWVYEEIFNLSEGGRKPQGNNLWDSIPTEWPVIDCCFERRVPWHFTTESWHSAIACHWKLSSCALQQTSHDQASRVVTSFVLRLNAS